jgi:predicted AlkP superfamily pyrophosphatase or phosphodiesterase
MNPVLVVFFDGLKPESLEFMPFLNSFKDKRRMRTILGYSVACHASMYTGIYPDKHLLWFVWRYAPETSPFKWVRYLRNIPLMNTLPGKYFFTKTAQLFERNTSYFGIPMVVNLPLKYWHYFDVSEKKFWDEPGYLPGYPTIFEILRSKGMRIDIVGMDKDVSDIAEIERYQFTEIKPFTYLFVGSVDLFSHRLGQDSPEARKKLKGIDQLIERQYKELEKRKKFFHFIAFSDHGHIKVTKRVDLYALFKEKGQDLNRYLHVIDANYARFWFRDDGERTRIEKILAEIPFGYILTEDLLKKYHVVMPDNRYGDLIFYLDIPHVFSKTIWGFSRSINSMHGYSPDHADSDGVFISNQDIKNDTPVALVDILPTLLSLLGIEIPPYVDGRNIWNKIDG